PAPGSRRGRGRASRSPQPHTTSSCSSSSLRSLRRPADGGEQRRHLRVDESIVVGPRDDAELHVIPLQREQIEPRGDDAALPGVFEAREAALDPPSLGLERLRLLALEDRLRVEAPDRLLLLLEDRAELALRPVDVERHADRAGAARAIAERDV